MIRHYGNISIEDLYLSLFYIIFAKMKKMSATNLIREQIERKAPGEVFLLKDFSELGSENVVKKTLSRLCLFGKITRLGKGIYCITQTDSIFGFGMIYPSQEQIAQAVARAEGVSIIPTMEFAMNALNLSTQIQTNTVFLTDGCRRHINLEGYKGNGITFIHCSNHRLFDIKDRRMLLIILSMKGIGEKNLDGTRMDLIKSHLKHVSLQDYMHDIKLAPVWIQKKLIS